MKKVLVGFLLLAALCFPARADAQVLRLLLRRAHCYGYGVVAVQQTMPLQTQPDPLTISLLTKIATQQEAMATQLAVLNQNRQAVQVDPSLANTLAAIAAGQDRVVQAIQAGQVANNAALADMMRTLASNQDRLLIALQNNRAVPCVNPPPVVVTPPPGTPPVVVTTPPPVIVTPPAGGSAGVPFPPGGNPAGGIFTIPSPGGPLLATPLPGGALQLTPQPGGSLQAVPGPGGSLQILPNGVAPPNGTGPGTGVLIQQGPSGTSVTPLPGAGGAVSPTPGSGGTMTPLPGPGGTMSVPSPGSSFKIHTTTTYPKR